MAHIRWWRAITAAVKGGLQLSPWSECWHKQNPSCIHCTSQRSTTWRSRRKPHPEHRFPAPSSKDVVNQCLELGRKLVRKEAVLVELSVRPSSLTSSSFGSLVVTRIAEAVGKRPTDCRTFNGNRDVAMGCAGRVANESVVIKHRSHCLGHVTLHEACRHRLKEN